MIFTLRINIFCFCQRICCSFHNSHFHYLHSVYVLYWLSYYNIMGGLTYLFRFITIAFYEDEIRLFNNNLIIPNRMDMNIIRLYEYNIHYLIYLHVFYFTWCNIFYGFNTFLLELHSHIPSTYYEKNALFNVIPQWTKKSWI